MCVAVPLRIAEIDGDNAVAEANGVSRSIKINFIKNPMVGDYVIVHAGFAIEKLKKEQAEENLEAWEILNEALRDTAL